MCDYPINIKNNSPHYDMNYRQVPCGKCYKCRLKYVNGWILRLQQKAKKYHAELFFVTLTYAKTPISKNGLPTLDKSDVQKFLKRLRKISKEYIQYVCVGEYGEKRKRPHYHLIIFGANYEDIVNTWENFENTNGSINGHVHIGYISEASIAYTFKYVDKKQKVPGFKGDDRNKQHISMSKHLGIEFLTDNMIRYIRSNKLTTIQIGNQTFPLNRYYLEKIYSKKELRDISKEKEKKYEKKFKNVFDDIKKYRTYISSVVQSNDVILHNHFKLSKDKRNLF